MRRLLLACLALAACRSTEPPPPRTLDLAVPDAYASGTDEEVSGGAWWETFGSSHLDGLVVEALAQNRDLRAAAIRIEAAEAQARITGASRRPAVNLNANRTRQQSVFVGLPIPGGPNVLSNTFTQYGVSLDVAWEADLWGRLASAERASRAELEATELDLQAARQSLAAQTTKAWIAWRLAAGQADLAARTLATYERDLELVGDRFEAGLASSFDQRLARARYESASATVQASTAGVEVAARQVETLLGRYPSGELALDDPLPVVPPVPAVGLPSELVARRPDLRAAAMRVAAADAQLDAARAERYPRFNISGSAGRISDVIDDLSDSDFDVWSLVLGLAQPLYAGGRIEAGIDAADAGARALLEAWAQTALVAFFEVESALVVEDNLVEQEAALGRALEEARAAREIAEERYRAGLDDLSVVLEADRAALDAERSLLDVHARRLDSRVDLHLALGGDLGDDQGAGEGR